jgi:ferritin-like metal-binding protein YciE
MAAMTDPRELLLHELKDIYYVEKALVKTLPTLSREATDNELRKDLERHLQETRQQVKNVERAFRSLGERPAAEQCPGFDGIKREHDEFIKEESPSKAVRDMFLTGAAARTEHYEIAAYTGLIAKARAMGEKEVAQLLDENLKQEKEALKKAESAGRRLAREHAKGNGGAASRSGSRSAARTRRPGGRSTSRARSGSSRSRSR